MSMLKNAILMRYIGSDNTAFSVAPDKGDYESTFRQAVEYSINRNCAFFFAKTDENAQIDMIELISMGNMLPLAFEKVDARDILSL